MILFACCVNEEIAHIRVLAVTAMWAVGSDRRNEVRGLKFGAGDLVVGSNLTQLVLPLL